MVLDRCPVDGSFFLRAPGTAFLGAHQFGHPCVSPELCCRDSRSEVHSARAGERDKVGGGGAGLHGCRTRCGGVTPRKLGIARRAGAEGGSTLSRRETTVL